MRKRARKKSLKMKIFRKISFKNLHSFFFFYLCSRKLCEHFKSITYNEENFDSFSSHGIGNAG